MAELRPGCLEGIAESIDEGVLNIKRYLDCVIIDEHIVYWTPHGTLSMSPYNPEYFFHNNGITFLFRFEPFEDMHGKGERLNIGMFASDLKDGYLESLLEMQHSILSRVLMTSVPRCSKLMELTEVRMEELPERMKREEIKWIIY